MRGHCIKGCIALRARASEGPLLRASEGPLY